MNNMTYNHRMGGPIGYNRTVEEHVPEDRVMEFFRASGRMLSDSGMSEAMCIKCVHGRHLPTTCSIGGYVFKPDGKWRYMFRPGHSSSKCINFEDMFLRGGREYMGEEVYV